MQLDKLLSIPEDADIEYLKDIITKDDLILLYWIISNYEDEFSPEQLVLLDDFINYLENNEIDNNGK